MIDVRIRYSFQEKRTITPKANKRSELECEIHGICIFEIPDVDLYSAYIAYI